jgi:hypothetical protein
MNISLNNDMYEGAIAALRTANGDLNMLRKHLIEFRTQNCYGQCQDGSTKACGKQLSKLSSDYGTIRDASQALHEALTTAWSCSKLAHISHSAKLLLDVKVEREVFLKLIILSESYPLDAR